MFTIEKLWLNLPPSEFLRRTTSCERKESKTKTIRKLQQYNNNNNNNIK